MIITFYDVFKTILNIRIDYENRSMTLVLMFTAVKATPSLRLPRRIRSNKPRDQVQLADDDEL